jgi:hypothetical protein
VCPPTSLIYEASFHRIKGEGGISFFIVFALGVRFVTIVFLETLLRSRRGKVAAAEAQPPEHSKIVIFFFFYCCHRSCMDRFVPIPAIETLILNYQMLSEWK